MKTITQALVCEKSSACVSREKSQAKFKGSKYLMMAETKSKCFKRPENAQKDEAELDVLRKCVSSKDTSE